MSNELFKKEFISRYKACFRTLHGISIKEGSLSQKYEALVITLREIIVDKWVKTNENYIDKKIRQVYYFSIEFLPGRLLDNYLVNIGIKAKVEESLKDLDINLKELEDQERDVALGSGGLGRLASCFLDSMASIGMAGNGCGISYKYGLFQQRIIDGDQVEFPDRWHTTTYSVWQFVKRDKALKVRFGGNAYLKQEENGKLSLVHTDYETVLAVPYDIPVVGYNCKTVNTLRLWGAEVLPEAEDDMRSQNAQERKKAMEYKYSVEALSEVLYPDDSNYRGKMFRLKQQYFMVSAGVQSIINYYKKKYQLPLEELNSYIALHINDTHPALVIPELMRILIDEEGFGWDDAWKITTSVVSYTNHTIMPEAMEKWAIEIVKALMPRVYQIIEEIDRRVRIDLQNKYPNDWEKVNSMSIIHDGQVFMANLAVHGSYSVNGVAQIHTEILKKDVLHDFYDYCPYKFNNKTNGVTHRRWLLNANPSLADLITSRIGKSWVTHPEDLQKLMEYSKDKDFLNELSKVKQENKERLAKYILEKKNIVVDTNSIFDVQIKRIHAYKRQFLNAWHIFYLYNALKSNPNLDIVPRTFIFAGKAAPSYYLAKSIIKFINMLGEIINNDKTIKDKLKIVFLENYNVSLAEIIVPAAEVSEQISLASKEASGTGNMKMMMNGAVTIGTLDGANVEIKQDVGEDNFITFGLTADEVLELNRNGSYSARAIIENDPRHIAIVEKIAQGILQMDQRSLMSINNYIYTGNDEFYIMKDFDSYALAQEKINTLYKNRDKWLEMSAVNIAKSGVFSSDRTVKEYAVGIWKVNSNL